MHHSVRKCTLCPTPSEDRPASKMSLKYSQVFGSDHFQTFLKLFWPIEAKFNMESLSLFGGWKGDAASLNGTCHVTNMTAVCLYIVKKAREKSRECHNHKPQPFPDPKRKRKLTNLNKHKPNKRTKSTKISSLFPKRGNRNTKRTEKHKNKMTHGKTYNKSPRTINHKATKSKTNTGTTALERSVERSQARSLTYFKITRVYIGITELFCGRNGKLFMSAIHICDKIKVTRLMK